MLRHNLEIDCWQEINQKKLVFHMFSRVYFDHFLPAINSIIQIEI